MTNLDDLYRARRGEQNEQRENFLSAATGLLLSQNPLAARAFLSLYGEDEALPAGDGAQLHVSSQEPIYNTRSGAMAGIADLYITWRRTSGERRVLVVEAKVDDQLKRWQPKGYAKALGGGAEAEHNPRVVTLTANPDDQQIWPNGHSTWQAWRGRLQAVQGPLAEALREQLDRWDLGIEQALVRRRMEAHAASSARIASIDSAFRSVVPLLVRGKALRTQVGGLPDDRWDEDWDVGQYLQLPKGRAKGWGLAFDGVGLSLRARADGIAALGWLRPRDDRKQWRTALVSHEKRPWVPEPGTDWLFARLGSWAADDTPLEEVARQAILRCRGALKRSTKLGDWGDAGLWTGAGRLPEGLPGEWSSEWTTARLAEDVRLVDGIHTAADALAGSWVDQTWRLVEGEHKVPCRHVYSRDGSFYEKNGIAQVGVDVDSGDLDRPASCGSGSKGPRGLACVEQCWRRTAGRAGR